MYFAVLLNFICADVILDLSCSLIAKVSYPYNTVGNDKGYILVFSVCVVLDLIGF